MLLLFQAVLDIRRFEVLTAVDVSMSIFWVVTPCGPIGVPVFFPCGTTAHTWALSSSVLRFLNHIQLDAR
jgi:hypothetical protein